MRQKELLKSLFCRIATPAANGFAGFPPAPSRSQLAHIKHFKEEIESGMSNRRHI